MKNSKAFTLAEVLIVLSVIGVIAVLTVPTLMKNYQAVQLRSAFLEANSIVKNTSAALIADDISIEELSPEEVANYFKINDFKTRVYSDNIYKKFTMKGNVASANANRLAGEFTLPNGMTGLIIRPNEGDSGAGSVNNLIGIDINGIGNKPNAYGRDVFFWYQNPISKNLELTGSETSKKYLNIYTMSCSARVSGAEYAEDGTGCGIYALIDPDWFKNLP